VFVVWSIDKFSYVYVDKIMLKVIPLDW
jgi:hypothetical protein